MILNYTQLLQYAQASGYNALQAPIIAAIAMAESGGNTQAVNASDPFGGSYGVLQINGSHIIGLSGSSITVACALDPACAFSYSYGLSRGGADFTPWSTYTSGAYKQYVQTPLPVPLPVGTGSGGVLTAPGTFTAASTAGSDPLGAISNFLGGIQAVAAWIGNPTRILKLIGGFLCIGGAIWLLVASPETEAAVKSAVKTAARLKSPPALRRKKA